jgi:lysyl-tRNA synthetase class 2
MFREPVSSSMIAAVGYDEDREVLEVEFSSGTVYRYLRVSLAVFEAFLAARSKGRFFNERIKDAYPWEQVDR